MLERRGGGAVELGEVALQRGCRGALRNELEVSGHPGALLRAPVEGALGAGAMMAGLLVSAGVGLLVLLRTNRHLKENLAIVGILYVTGVAWGLVVNALGIVF